MAYTPRPVPLRTEDLARFLTEELQFIAREVTQAVPYLLLDTVYAPPKKLITGMISKADGVIWNPGSGAGPYIYNGATWTPMFGAGGGAAANSLVVTVDFGSGWTDKAQTIVTGQAWVNATKEIVAHVITPAGVDPDEMYLLGMRVEISDIVAATGFTATVYSEAEATGTYFVHVIGN